MTAHLPIVERCDVTVSLANKQQQNSEQLQQSPAKRAKHPPAEKLDFSRMYGSIFCLPAKHTDTTSKPAATSGAALKDLTFHQLRDIRRHIDLSLLVLTASSHVVILRFGGGVHDCERQAKLPSSCNTICPFKLL